VDEKHLRLCMFLPGGESLDTGNNDLHRSRRRLCAGVHYRSPIMGIAGVYDAVFVALADGHVDAIRPNALEVWNFDTEGTITTPPVIVDGAVCVGNANDNLCAFTVRENPVVAPSP
jgi:PQQ-like domain